MNGDAGTAKAGSSSGSGSSSGTGSGSGSIGQPPNHRDTASARTPAESPHGAPIDILAISDGAKAALTGDELGSMRLWPALDGSREPRVIDLPRAKKLALGARGDGFVAAIIDDVGGVIVTSLDGDGKKLGHVTLPIDPPFTDVVMTPSGALAWRSDQVLQLVDAKVGVVGTLPAEHGTRIVAIAASGERAIAIVDAAGKHKARWIMHAPKLAWGAWVPMHDSASFGETVSLSPTGNRLVTTIDNATTSQSQIMAIDTATGKLVASTPGKGPVGFVDDDHLALATGDGATWFDVSKPATEPTTPPNPAQAERAVLATGGGRAITTTDAELVIAKPGDVKYLGYEMLTPAVASAGPKGQLLIGLGDTFAMLDTTLRQISVPSLALPPASTVSYLAYLGDDDWLVQASKIADGSTSLALVDVAKGKATSVKDRLQTPEPMQHDASTQLITLSLGDSPEVMRYDPQTRKLVHVASPAKPKGYEQIALAPLSPALANGNQLVAIRTRDRVKLSWIKDATQLDTETSTITIDGSFAGVDPAGHVFVWQNNAQGKLEIVVYADGKKLGVLPTEGQTALWPDPSGKRVIEITPQSVGLFGLDGKRVWIAALSGANEAVWLADGSIAVLTSAGVARLDAGTGQIAATRCGWRFGLSAKPHPQAPHLEPVCSQ